MSRIISELQRRNVFRVAGAYAVVAWLLAQMAGVLENSLNMPAWFDTVVVSFLLIGFPIALILAWAFEMTPEGIKRTEDVLGADSIAKQTGRKLDYVLIGGLALVGLLIVGDRLMPETAKPAAAGVAAGKAFAGQSIAVLPFEDFSPAKDQAYFADGIAEELLNVLARVDGLRVASRTSAFSYKGREASIAEIGAALNVAHILEGSVRKAGDTLRITAQLIDTKTDEHLWSETYDRPLTAENIFEIQDEISKAIVLELNGRLDLLPETNERATQSTEALEAYLKGKGAYGPRSAEGIETGITELIRAVTLDPEFAVAHAKLARAYTLTTFYSDMSPETAFPRAKIHIERAQALAPNDWEVLAEYAWFLAAQRNNYRVQDNTTEQVVAAFDAAIAANPNNAEAYRGKGNALSTVGRLDEAKIAFERAKELNPRESLIYLNLTAVAEVQGDIEAAKKLSIEAVQIDRDALLPRASLASAYDDLGEVVTAHRVYQSCRVERGCAERLYVLYARLGIDADDLRVEGDYLRLIELYFAGEFDRLAQVLSASTEALPTDKVAILATIGRWDEAYELIQKNPSVFELFLQGAPSADIATNLTEIALLATLERKGDPRAKAVRASLSNKYRNVRPGEHADSDIYYNGAAWAMLEGDPDRAMVWLNALAARGKSTLASHDALFEPLKPRADYQAFLARMDGFKARDRALIEAQLANPPAIWWSPDELSKGAK